MNLVKHSSICNFRDSLGGTHSFTPIACIEFQGTLSWSGDSRGHYICDVKTHQNKQWLRTNDNDEPKKIDEEQVSNLPYVVLYKKV